MYLKQTKLIATINLKGGSTKTSTILNLGGVMHESGYKPLLIDSDPQQSATRWAQQGAENFPYPVVPLDIGKNIKKLKESLDKLVENHKADTVLFDTPPQLEEEAILAALLADIVIIPIGPSPLDLWAAEKAVETIKEARKERKEKLPKAILVPSRLMTNTLLAKEINTSLKQFNEPISPAITARVAMAEAPIAGLPIHLYSPNSQSHIEFKNLLKFVLMNLRK
jgi:chromosome partitioning protein